MNWIWIFKKVQAAFGSKSLKSLDPKIWNNIPSHIKSTKNLNVHEDLIEKWNNSSCGWKQLCCREMRSGVLVITAAQLFFKKGWLRFCTGSYPVFVGRFSTVRTSNNGAGWKYDLKQIVRYQSKLYGHLKFKRFMMSKIL